MPDTTDLHIPDEARAAMARHLRLPDPHGGFRSAVDWAEVDRDLLEVAAPVVAAELRRLAVKADELRTRHTPVGDDPARRAAVTAYANLRDLISVRAAELDGGDTR